MIKKRKLKKSVKFVIGVTVLIVVGIGSYFIYEGMKPQQIKYGSIDYKEKSQLGKIREETLRLSEKPGAEMTYTIYDVGEGQSILIDYGEMEVLIDGGPKSKGKYVSKKIRNKIDGELDYVIATHHDPNNIGGLIQIYKDYKVGKTIYGNRGESDVFKSFEQIAKASGQYEKKKDSTIELGDRAAITIFDVEEDRENSNNNSVITLVNYNQVSFFCSGDAQEGEEVKLKNRIEPVDVVIAGFKGDNSANKLLPALSPKYFIISAGRNNPDGHPHSQTLKAAENEGAAVYGTFKSGDIRFSTDGIDLSCNVKEEQELTPADAGAKK